MNTIPRTCRAGDAMKIPRWLRLMGIWVLGIIVALISLYALFYAWVSWSAKREWVQTKKELEARGEKLSFVDFVPVPIPDEQNFFATPLFLEDLKSSDGSTQIKELNITPQEGGSAGNVSNMKPIDSKGFMNLEYRVVQFRLRSKENQNLSAAAIILAALDKKPDKWEELYKAAEKPGARFPLPYEKVFGSSVLMAHVSAILKFSQILPLRATAHMEIGKSNEAKRDIILIIRLSDALSSEPLLISQLVRLSCISSAPSRIWEGIQRHVWTSDQLEDFENRLASENVLPGLILALRGERAQFDTSAPQIIQGQKDSRKAFFNFEQDDVTKRKEPPRWSGSIPWTWLYWSMAFFSSEVQKRIDVLEVASVRGISRKNINEFPDLHGFRRWKYLLASIAFPSIESTTIRFVQTQAWVDMARIACVLERYKIANNAYPENLDQLVPVYIEKLPNDIASAKPYHYQRNAPERFALWSVGFDGVDDNGRPVATKESKEGDWVWGVFGYQKPK